MVASSVATLGTSIRSLVRPVLVTIFGMGFDVIPDAKPDEIPGEVLDVSANTGLTVRAKMIRALWRAVAFKGLHW